MIISVDIRISDHLTNILVLKRPVYAQQKCLKIGKRDQFVFIAIDWLKSLTHVCFYLCAIYLASFHTSYLTTKCLKLTYFITPSLFTSIRCSEIWNATSSLTSKPKRRMRVPRCFIYYILLYSRSTLPQFHQTYRRQLVSLPPLFAESPQTYKKITMSYLLSDFKT
jgi:hypothetical protein